MNNPFTYRGYRFFQAQTIPLGNARTIDLTLVPENGGEPINIQIPRLGSTTLADGTFVEYLEFLPDFIMNGDKPDTRFGMKFVELNELVRGKAFKIFDEAELVVGICVEGAADYTRKQLDELTDLITREQVTVAA